MKRLIIISLAMGLSLIARPAVAANIRYESFVADVTVGTDASITVTETINVDFLSALHGFYRSIPFRYQTTNGGKASMPVAPVQVLMDGADIPYTTSVVGDDLQLKIGDPDRTITGRHVYTIEYTVKAAVNFFADHDELYWNITGDRWDQSLSDVRATIHLPSGAIESIQLACYTGERGSKATDCTKTTVNQVTEFTAQDFLTVVVGWPVGLVTKPADYESLRASVPDRLVEPSWWMLPGWAALILSVMIPMLALGMMIRRWRRHGRDPRGQGTIIAQYDPPAGMTPAEVGVLIDEKASDRDVTSTIVDLAVRGWLTITEEKKSGVLGFGGGKDYRLDRKREDTQSLRTHESDMMSGLFGHSDFGADAKMASMLGPDLGTMVQKAMKAASPNVNVETGAPVTSITLSYLKGTFADDVAKIKRDLYTQLVADGYFASDPRAVITKYLLIGIGLGVLTLPLAIMGAFGAPLAGLVIMCFAPFMPARTTKGVAAREHALGFKEFLATAEKYRIKWQEKEGIFEKYLPYAMVFGVADKWANALSSLATRPPDWYHGSTPGSFNTLMLWSALNSFQSASAQSFAPPAASGGSGFGGGGFSGGGGGGGGGGGW